MPRLKKVQEGSVQKTDALTYKNQIIMFGAYDQVVPPWWSPQRDRWFRDFWPTESFLAGALYSIASRNAAFGWELQGLEEDVAYTQDILQSANFGNGWQDLITKVTLDLLTQDNGAFIEVIRPARVRLENGIYPAYKMRYENDNERWYADVNGRWEDVKALDIFDSPLDLPIGVAHLDAAQVQRTGDADIPAIYTDRWGKMHKLRWWQVLMFTDLPSPIEKMNGVGYSALSRIFRAAHIAQSLSIYKDEKISGRFARTVFLTNVDPESIQDAINQSEDASDGRGLTRYSQPIIAATLNPDSAPAVVPINLAEVPDGFNEDSTLNWYVAQLANALGVDYNFLAPLPGKGLGTASQSENMARQAKGKSSRQFMDMLANAFNFKGVLPESVKFAFIERDIDGELQDEAAKKARAETRKIMLENGEITPEIARQMAVDCGDLDDQYLELLGSADLTPAVTIQGDENIESDQAIEAGVSEVQETVTLQPLPPTKALPVVQIKARQKQLFSKPTLQKRIMRLGRKLFRGKQIQIPEVDNPELETALAEYGDELEALALQARNGEIPQSEFEQRLADMLTITLTALFAQMVGKDPQDFNAQDTANLDEYLTVNIEAAQGLTNDIYAGNYEDTEERDGLALLLMRLGLWVGNALALSILGEITNPQNAEDKYQWDLGVAEHCDSCLYLNGQVHTASEWAQSGWYPRNHNLLCNGFNCACNLRQVDKNTPSNGSLSGVPT